MATAERNKLGRPGFPKTARSTVARVDDDSADTRSEASDHASSGSSEDDDGLLGMGGDELARTLGSEVCCLSLARLMLTLPTSFRSPKLRASLRARASRCPSPISGTSVTTKSTWLLVAHLAHHRTRGTSRTWTTAQIRRTGTKMTTSRPSAEINGILPSDSALRRRSLSPNAR